MSLQYQRASPGAAWARGLIPRWESAMRPNAPLPQPRAYRRTPMPKLWTRILGCLRSTRSGREFSPYELVIPTAPGYSFDALLANAIERPAEEDASDYGDDALGDRSEGGLPRREDEGRPGADDSDGAPMWADSGCAPGSPAASLSHPPTPSTAPAPTAPKKPRRRSAKSIAAVKLRAKRDRAIKRQQEAARNFARPKRALQSRSVRGSSPLAAPFKVAGKRVAKTAWVGLRDPKPAPTAGPAVGSDGKCEAGREYESDGSAPESEFNSDCEADSEDEPMPPGREARAYTAKEMVEGRGFGYMPWDGKVPRPVTDGSGHVVANLVGCPGDPSWEGVHRRATELLREAGGRIRCTAKDTSHRRGNFKALAKGIRYGTGMTKPGNANNTTHNDRIMDSLMRSKEFARVASFTNSCFHTWAPRLHKYYGDTMEALCARHPHLQRNFAPGESVFACSTINFGPATESFPHTDNNNLAWGWCAVTALGNYDPTLGGHLILWDLKLVIEFPPGATVLIPSAIFTHSNTAIQEGETRYSFTQYTSGGLFRWVEHGYRGEKAYNEGLSRRERKEEAERKTGRWAKGMNMYSTIAELISLYK